jgi:hypothetical protein
MPQSIFTFWKPQPVAPPSMTKRPTTPLSLLTMSWKMLNTEQLAHETWTYKDPLCRRPHHLTPMGYLSTPSTETSRDLRPCPCRSSRHGSVTIPTPQPCMAVSLRLQETLAQSPLPHLTAPRFVAEPWPKATTLQSHVKSPQKTFPIWRWHMARQQLAVDAAHALLLGVSSHSHPLSLRCQSPAQSPSDPRIPDRVVEATHTDPRQQ